MPVFSEVKKHVKAKSGIHFYRNVVSQNCLRVDILLDEKGLIHNVHNVDLVKGEQFEQKFLDINPAGLIPALVYDGVAVSESSDIMKYLEMKHPESSFTPKNETDKSMVHAWVDRSADMHIGAFKELLYINGMGRPASKASKKMYELVNPELADFHKKYGKGFSEKQKKSIYSKIDTYLTDLEKTLARNTYVASNEYTIADMSVYAVIIYLKLNNYPISQYKNIRTWYKKIHKRPAVKRSVKRSKLNIPFPIFRVLMKLAEKKGRKAIAKESL